MRGRTWPIMLLGFGSLVLLIALLGLGALRRVELIHSEMRQSQQQYIATEKLLYEIRSGIYLSSIFVRDFLLDPSHLSIAPYQEQLLVLRREMSLKLDRLDDLERQGDILPHRLRVEVEAYWKSLEPLFTWSPQQKQALSAVFLRRQILPRRDAVLDIAKEVAEINSATLARHQTQTEGREAELRLFLVRLSAVGVSLGVLVAALSILRIATLERRAVNQRMQTERAERELRLLSLKLVEAQEQERKEISRELHDEIGQMLTALRMDLANLAAARTQPDAEFRERLSGSKQLVEQTLRFVRNMAMGLRPSMLDDLGLAPALDWQAREFSRRAGIPVELEVHGELEDIPERHRVCIYRVAQEALTNCARHANASRIRIQVEGGGDSVSMTVEDDGAGFLQNGSSRRGLGLVGIEERVRELGGAMKLTTHPGKGVSLRIELPLTQEASV
jgi:signal transduction histidine kinase